MSEIVTRELVVGKLLLLATFPEEVQIDIRSRFLCALHKAGERLVEPKKDVGCLHLAAFAVRRLHLQRSVVVGEDRADPEIAFLFVEDVHARQPRSASETTAEDSEIWTAVECSISRPAEVSAAL